MRKPTTAKAVPIPAPTVKTPDIPRHEEEVKILYEKVADVINDSIILPFEPDQTPEYTSVYFNIVKGNGSAFDRHICP